MTRRQYPRLGRIDHQFRWAKQPAHEGPRCIVCGGKAIYKVHVEFDIFRGDDEVLKACRDHAGDVRALVGAWQAAQPVKDDGQLSVNAEGTTVSSQPHDQGEQA